MNKLPIDHHGLPDSYAPSDDLLPRLMPSLKDWAVATIAVVGMTAGLATVFAMIDLLPLALDLRAMVNAATDGNQVCRIDTINGIRVEHCIRTIYRF